MSAVTIKGDNGSILIEVLGYENAAASNDSDSNWLTSTVTVVAGAFSGQLNGSLTTQNFAYFHRELGEILGSLKGKAVFEADEEWLHFEVEMGSRGTAKVRGVAIANDGTGASLTFAFETDQTYLTQTKSALDSVVKSFPIRQL